MCVCGVCIEIWISVTNLIAPSKEPHAKCQVTSSQLSRHHSAPRWRGSTPVCRDHPCCYPLLVSVVLGCAVLISSLGFNQLVNHPQRWGQPTHMMPPITSSGDALSTQRRSSAITNQYQPQPVDLLLSILNRDEALRTMFKHYEALWNISILA